MHRSPIGNLVPLDLEIEAMLRRNRAERRRKLLQDMTLVSFLEEETHFSDSSSSNSPSSRESLTYLPEVFSMANEHQQRLTLEDYSSSSVPQFFTSIARPEVQAHNINYPHSLIHLIRLGLFSISLAGKTKRWLQSFKGNSLKTWEEVVEKFLKKYFPESKIAEGKAVIFSFHQFLDGSFSEALERF